MKMLPSSLMNKHWKWGIFILLALTILLLPLPAQSAQASEKYIQIQASSYEYNPGVVRVKPGERVTLELTSTDVTHGIYIDGYNLEVIAEPGQTQTLSFVADQTGTFRLRCSVTCGALHPFMTGKLQVGTNALLWKSIAIAALGIAVVIWTVRT
ncbi:MAG: cytochrome c oxidase subunit [Chloroflexi bacterium]|nr:cytochrome c oxidase subunit [Chloroflexota bacterium]